MKYRKQRQIISLLLLVLMLTATSFQAIAEGEVTVRELLTDLDALVYIEQTPYLLAKERKGTLWGVYSTDGEERIPYAYASLSYLSHNCFNASDILPKNSKNVMLNEINSHALVTADGTQVSDFLYGSLQVFSPYWACGWILEYGSEEDFDCQISDTYYRIGRCDLFYLGDHALLGKTGTENLSSSLSLTRDEFKDAAGHGKYLYVQDRQDQIKVYDSGFHQLDIETAKLSDPIYIIKNWAVKRRGSDEIVIDGFSAVQEMPTEAGLRLKVSRLDYSGKKWNSVYTVEGEQLMPWIEEEISSVTSDYALLSANKKQGIYSFRENRLLASCMFDKVIANTTTLDPYLLHGYLCVENSGTRYYLRVSDGEMFEAASLDKKWKKIGDVYVLRDGANSRYKVISPDQKENIVNDARILKGNDRGSGYLLSFTSEVYQNMVVDWYGNMLIRFYSNPMTITDDDKVIVQTKSNTYKLFEIVSEE